MTWRRSLNALVNSHQDGLVDADRWATTFGTTADEVTLELARLRADRDAIEVIRARPENEDVGQ